MLLLEARVEMASGASHCMGCLAQRHHGCELRLAVTAKVVEQSLLPPQVPVLVPGSPAASWCTPAPAWICSCLVGTSCLYLPAVPGTVLRARPDTDVCAGWHGAYCLGTVAPQEQPSQQVLQVGWQDVSSLLSLFLQL